MRGKEGKEKKDKGVGKQNGEKTMKRKSKSYKDREKETQMTKK